MVARREGLPATKIRVSDGPGAEFLVYEIHGGAPGPAVGTPQRVRIRTAKPVRSSPHLLLGAAHGKGGRSSPPGPGELGIVPGSFTGGQYFGGSYPITFPPLPVPALLRRRAEAARGSPFISPSDSPGSASYRCHYAYFVIKMLFRVPHSKRVGLLGG